MITRHKVAIIGMGSVGSSFAFALMQSGLAREIALVDNNEKKALGECMDLNHGMSFVAPTKIYSRGFDGIKDADIVVVAAGAKQHPGETRIDLVEKNLAIFKEIIPKVTAVASETVLLVVTNPVDILTYVTLKISGFPRARVLGSGTTLDTSRLRYLLSEHCKVDARNVHAYIIGEHGDTELAVWSNANIGGMKVTECCPACVKSCDSKKDLDAIFEEVKNAAYKIIEAKEATYYAVALALVRIIEAILRDENSILPVSTLIDDYYGIKDVCLSLPSLVNRKGVERFLRIDLSKTEQKKLQYSADTLKKITRQLRF